MSRVTAVEHTAIGGFAAMVEAVTMQPLLAVKNALQEGRAVPRNPLHLYRGVGINAMSMVPITAVQFGANRLGEQVFGAGSTKLGGGSRLVCAATAGMLSAFIGSPSELIIIHQQKSGRSLPVETLHLLRAYGPTVFTRGLGMCMARESVYATGYLGLFPVLRERLEEGGYSAGTSTLMAGITSGVIAAFFSHPFDTIKTKLQVNMNGEGPHKDVLSSSRKILETGGVTQFWRGVVPRGLRIVGAVFLLNGTKNAGVEYFEKRRPPTPDLTTSAARPEAEAEFQGL